MCLRRNAVGPACPPRIALPGCASASRARLAPLTVLNHSLELLPLGRLYFEAGLDWHVLRKKGNNVGGRFAALVRGVGAAEAPSAQML